MSERPDGTAHRGDTAVALSHDIVSRVTAVVGAVLCTSEVQIEADVRALEQISTELFERKLAMLGAKSDMRNLIAEVVFQRVRRGIRALLDHPQPADEVRITEHVLGGLLTEAALADLAIAFDRLVLERSGPRDYSFAGRCDFISVEEVMQLLGGGKHQGRLSLEKGDNRLDIYLSNGLLTFLDPHHIERRVLPGTGQNYREIPKDVLEDAERRHAEEEAPIFLTLHERGCFKDLELRSAMRQLGCEVLYDFLRDQDQTSFFYRQLKDLPRFAQDHNLRLGVTPVLLEGSKRLDDWRSMVKVFPDPTVPVEPVADMYARIAQLDLGVLEIKMLAQVNGENSPRDLVRTMGLPLHDIYQYLVRFAREGVLVPPGGVEALHDLSMSVEESMKMAFEALDANDDEAQIGSALDRVLGGGDNLQPRPQGGVGGSEKFNLDFLRAAHKDDG